MKKNSFLAFCFAFIPGGGEMYLGMMKRGLLLMLSFFGICSVGWLLQIEFTFWFTPVVWFYSFFETINNIHSTEEERRSLDDQIHFRFENLISDDFKKIISKRYALVGGGLIFFGIYLLFSNFVQPMLERIMEQLGYDFWLMRVVAHRLPSLFVSVLIIALGVHLIKGKKKVSVEDDLVMFKGESHE